MVPCSFQPDTPDARMNHGCCCLDCCCDWCSLVASCWRSHCCCLRSSSHCRDHGLSDCNWSHDHGCLNRNHLNLPDWPMKQNCLHLLWWAPCMSQCLGRKIALGGFLCEQMKSAGVPVYQVHKIKTNTVTLGFKNKTECITIFMPGSGYIHIVTS